MNLLSETIQKISPLHAAAMQGMRERLHRNLPVPGYLGELEKILCAYAGITGEISPPSPRKCTIIACADHGVAEMNISAYPAETTVQMTKNYLLSKGATANALANFADSDLFVVDMGVAAPLTDLPGLIDRKIALGTQNCAKGPAMTRAQALQSVHTGIELANRFAAEGYRCFLPGEMGIANTTASAAIVATICDLTPKRATGRGTNISNERLKVKIEVVRQALEVNRPDPEDGLDVLSKVGGFELGCIAGIILGAAANRAFVVLDGFNTGAAALVAASLCPDAKHYLMGSHLAAEPAHRYILEHLDIQPYIDMQFRLGEATGSSIAVNLLDAALRVYRHRCDRPKEKPRCARMPQFPHHFVQKKLFSQIDMVQKKDEAAMQACQLYIDNLTKPLHSLGALEAIAVKIAGATGQARPIRASKVLFCFHADNLKAPLNPITSAFALHAQADVRLAPTQNSLIPPLRISLAVMCGSINSACIAINKGYNIIGFCGTAKGTQNAADNILLQIGTLPSIDPYLLLKQHGTEELAAIIGVILAAAQKRSIVVLDDFATQTAAWLAAVISPSVRDYLIVPEYSQLPKHIELPKLLGLPDYLRLGARIDAGGISALGMKLVDAAMYMLRDMKTFEDAAVAVANDGPGAGRQIVKIETRRAL